MLSKNEKEVLFKTEKENDEKKVVLMASDLFEILDELNKVSPKDDFKEHFVNAVEKTFELGFSRGMAYESNLRKIYNEVK